MSGCSHGPVALMPGQQCKVPSGQSCDKHPERSATHRYVGECDSFGCEYVDVCGECYEVHVNAKKDFANEGVCDLCDNEVALRKKWKDPEEGLAGRIYDACVPCIAEANARVDAEYPILDDGNDDDFDTNV